MIEFADILLEQQPHPFWKTLRQVGVERAVGICEQVPGGFAELHHYARKRLTALGVDNHAADVEMEQECREAENECRQHSLVDVDPSQSYAGI